MRQKTRVLWTMLGVFVLGAFSAVAQTNADFKEIYQLLRTNLAGTSTDELDRAAAQGLIHELGPRVSLVAGPAPVCDCDSVDQYRVFDNSFGYVRVESVTSNLPSEFHTAFQQMTETNKTKLRGLVLDLRFADGFDYAAAAKLADAFLSSDHPLLDWQSGSARATTKANAITLPLAILVNARTSGAAEAVAAVLRDNDVGLILGGQTAGQASVFKEFTLSNGQKLRVAVAPVKFGADKSLSRGVTPDIAVNTSLEDERAYQDNPYKVLHLAPVSKNDLLEKAAEEQPRMNETELIREHRNGEDVSGMPVRDAILQSPLAPVVADPTLARALDLLKGLAVVEPNRPG